MAADKRKILENARKLAQKNAKEKALAEYQKLLKLDPKDAKLRLEVGDAHRRWGQVDEAVETYQRVATQYMEEGFDARAVAVFKQILNLVPDRLDAYAPLAELYERMGLTAEALAALQTAADGYHRQGMKAEALVLLRKMANADPANTRSRIKVADLLRQEGKKDDAVAEYLLAAEELERQGDVDALGGVFRRILEVDERNVRALSTLAKTLGSRGKVNEAITFAERALQLDDGNAERYEQLAELLEQAKKAPEHERVMRRLAELYRSRGDDVRARGILQRFAAVGELSNATNDEDEIAPGAGDELAGGGLSEDDASALFGEEFPDEEGAPELAIDFGSELEIGPGASLSGGQRNRGPALAESTHIASADEELLLEEVHEPKPSPGDWEQLLAEASVYLRYGKRDKAIAQLQRVLAANPNHRGALEKLGEAHAESGDHAEAVQVWLRAALRAHDERDTEALRVLRARIAVLDESAAAQIPGDATAAAKKGPAPAKPAPAKSAPARPTPPPAKLAAPAPIDLALDDDDEFLEDLALDDASAAPAPPSASREIDLALDDDVDLPLDEGGDLALGDEPAPEAEVDVASGIEIDLEDAGDPPGDEIDFGSDGELTEEPVPAPAVARDLDADERQEVLDQLEEADFYMQQGLHDEAETLYRGVLASVPDHPRATQSLAEIAQARGGAAPRVAPARAESVANPEQTPVPDLDLDAEGDLTQPESEAGAGEDVEISVDFTDDEIGESAPALGAGAELDDLASLDLDDATGPQAAAEAESAGDGSDTEEFLRPAVEAPRSAPAAPAPALAASADEGDFDLAAALSDAFDGDSGSGARSAVPAGDDGFAAVFQAFKKGVRETLSEGDHQAHYDLAIAYKEMGLYEDAIYELRTAMADPNRTAECLHLIGLCAIDSNQAPLAIEHLEQLLALPSLAGDAALAARFDLGRAFEAIGDIEAARTAWQAVAAKKPDFQGVGARLAGLGQPKPEPAEEGLESFADVIESVAEAAEVVVGGETFDDLVAEANTEPAAESGPLLDAEPVSEAELVIDSEPAAEEPAGPRSPGAPKLPPPRRKKKISFL